MKEPAEENASPLIDVEITDVAFGGKGVARSGGKVLFVPFVLPGELVRVRVLRDRRKFAEAELVAILRPSPHRVQPPCPYFGRCGGCAYQHMAYAEQLRLKSRQVEQTIRRLGRINVVPMREPVASPLEYGYRNRIRVHLEGARVGFYAHGSHRLVDVEHCPIAAPEVNQALRELRNSPAPDGDYTVAARQRVFFEQTNTAVGAALSDLVHTLVPGDLKLIIDAYSGAGFFAHRLIDRAERVVGIEENGFAVEQARRQAGPHEQYVSGDVALHLGDLLAAAELERTAVILDPPAAGLSPRVSDLLLARPPATLVYVSCDPGTLARDLGALCRSSYRLQGVTALDMFPQTAEIETVAHLTAL